MSASRKLQAEIERTLKRVEEGKEAFDATYEKVRRLFRACHFFGFGRESWWGGVGPPSSTIAGTCARSELCCTAWCGVASTRGLRLPKLGPPNPRQNDPRARFLRFLAASCPPAAPDLATSAQCQVEPARWPGWVAVEGCQGDRNLGRPSENGGDGPTPSSHHSKNRPPTPHHPHTHTHRCTTKTKPRCATKTSPT